MLLHYDLCLKYQKQPKFFYKKENKIKTCDTPLKGDVQTRHYTNVMKLGKISNSRNVTLKQNHEACSKCNALKEAQFSFFSNFSFLLGIEIISLNMKYNDKTLFESNR